MESINGNFCVFDLFFDNFLCVNVIGCVLKVFFFEISEM